MSNLQKLPQTLDSREVADMVGMRHADLMRNIDHYIEIMGQNAKLRSDDFFIKQTYTAGTGKQYKRYDITKQGCEMVANKLTGEKGILFTAEYVKKFNEMERADNIKQVKQEQDKTKAMRAAAMLKNAETRQAKLLMEIAAASHIGSYKEMIMAKTANMLAGEELLPMPKSKRERERHNLKWYCRKIGKSESWSGQLGKELKKHNIEKKPGENGEYVEDTAQNNRGKQVQNFEWYPEFLLPVLTNLGFKLN